MSNQAKPLTRRQAILVGAKLRQAREAANLTQLAVARKAFNFEISHARVSRMERAVLPEVFPKDVLKVADVVGLKVAELQKVVRNFSARV